MVIPNKMRFRTAKYEQRPKKQKGKHDMFNEDLISREIYQYPNRAACLPAHPSSEQSSKVTPATSTS